MELKEASGKELEIWPHWMATQGYFKDPLEGSLYAWRLSSRDDSVVSFSLFRHTVKGGEHSVTLAQNQNQNCYW